MPWKKTEGRPDATQDARVNARLRLAPPGPCRHANVSVGRWTDRRTTPPTVTETITCDDCKATL